MRRVVITLVFLLFLCSISSAQTTLYDGWISFSSKYLGTDIWEYNYQWGASTTLSQEEIDNLFPIQYGDYQRMFAGIGQNNESFRLIWENPVELLEASSSSDFPEIWNASSIDYKHLGYPWAWWLEAELFKTSDVFSFRTRGCTGRQTVLADIDYYGWYEGGGEHGHAFEVLLSGTPLRVSGSFNPVPEPATLVSLGLGLVCFGGLTIFKRRKDIHKPLIKRSQKPIPYSETR